ncbi:MAG: PEP/pyruvate-binding domain-containing protein [Euryarchaeota archaeon]|nr:PEP/pyruvate-binding domain-containing protein [Euryarchaeota archaeon]MBU4608150.1 PEP/pyruvate-binding domain-containing protein [Euryarchaeota archaeon]MBV1728940.1 PEP/pyruvate-binding domain-containing protein [Methanobacterium sp.]MBV1755010.1 PEP/pyruvate-binding domain-containing protein [Methanobacterium sp.]MBV1768168.1 PEP/pyruvate-binding domain-containing protein [Methanobacterium sp.]
MKWNWISVNSSIAVLIQVMVEEEISGLAFSRDPRGKDDNMVIEAIEGFCSELVDNEKEPEKWIITRDREILSHKRPDTYKNTLLKSDELKKSIR